jgi:hypothetical protein
LPTTRPNSTGSGLALHVNAVAPTQHNITDGSKQATVDILSQFIHPDAGTCQIGLWNKQKPHQAIALHSSVVSIQEAPNFTCSAAPKFISDFNRNTTVSPVLHPIQCGVIVTDCLSLPFLVPPISCSKRVTCAYPFLERVYPTGILKKQTTTPKRHQTLCKECREVIVTVRPSSSPPSVHIKSHPIQASY